jgi:hypothetical protein
MLIGHQRLSFSFGHSANYRKHHPPVFVSSPAIATIEVCGVPSSHEG